MLYCEDIYEDLAKDVEKRIDTSNYELKRLFSKEKKKKKKKTKEKKKKKKKKKRIQVVNKKFENVEKLIIILKGRKGVFIKKI